MNKINNKVLDFWLGHLNEQNLFWHESPSYTCLETGSSIISTTKIEKIFGLDMLNNENNFPKDLNYYYHGQNKLSDLKGYHLMIIPYNDEKPDELLYFFKWLHPDGNLIIYDLNLGLSENTDPEFEKFRRNNSYRLKGLILNDNSKISYDGSALRHQLNILIFSKTKTHKIFIKPDFATKPDISKVHLISNLDKIYKDKESRWWHENPWTEKNPEYTNLNVGSLWNIHDVLNLCQGINFQEYSEIYNFEFYHESQKIIDDTYLSKKHISANKLYTNYLHEKSQAILEILFSEIFSKQINIYDGLSYSALTGENKPLPKSVYSTSYLGDKMHQNLELTCYSKDSIIKFFKEKFPKDHEFDIALKYFELIKNYVNDNENGESKIRFTTADSTYSYNIIFCNVGKDIAQEVKILTSLLIEWQEKITDDGLIIFQINDNKILESDKFKDFREDFLPYLDFIIDLGQSKKIKKNEPRAFFAIGKVRSQSFKLIDVSSYIDNIMRLKLQFNEPSNIINKDDINRYKESWKIKQEIFDKVKDFVKRVDTQDTEVFEKDLNIENKKTVKDEIIDAIISSRDDVKNKVESERKIGEKNINKHTSAEVEKMKKILLSLASDLDKIKKKHLEVEDAINLMSEKVESYRDNVNYNIKHYSNKVKDWLKTNWKKSEDYTKTVLPLSEYLYESLIELEGNSDFSSFIAYSSQALEIEFFQKIFFDFHKDIDENLNNDEKRELVNYNNIIKENKTKKNFKELDNYFHSYIISKRKKRKYSLGGMIHIINYLPNKDQENTIEYNSLKSLQYLEDFINSKMNKIDVEFMERLDNYRIKRNAAAHPGKMSRQDAEELWSELKDLINIFLSKIK